MKTGRSFFAAGFTAAAILLAAGFAQAGAAKSIDSLASARHCFEEATTESLVGVVKTVENRDLNRLSRGRAMATVITLATAEGDRVVYMGPKGFLEHSGCNLAPGMELSLEGVQANLNGHEIMLVKSYSSKDGCHNLRDDRGSLITSR